MPTRLALFFSAPSQVEIRETPIPEPSPGQVLVRTTLSAVSPGTELLIYRGLFPGDLTRDENIAAISGEFSYPLKYGYCTVGQVVGLGAGVDPLWLGKQVFAFNPHESHFCAPLETLLPIPPRLTAEQAVFLPNVETALNFVMDGRPLIGERVLVFGQGIVGLLTTSLLARFPLARLVTLDRFPLRRQASLAAGAHASLDPADPEPLTVPLFRLGGEADLAFELSGSPAALDAAIAATGFTGRIVIGSWYGQKQARLDLGGRFHRSRIHLISSQVSSIAPELSGRWDKARRFELAWKMLAEIQPARWITHRCSIHQAIEAYQLLDEHPEQTIQLIFNYP